MGFNTYMKTGRFCSFWAGINHRFDLFSDGISPLFLIRNVEI